MDMCQLGEIIEEGIHNVILLYFVLLNNIIENNLKT